jgi:hypothetical protein
MENVTCGIEQAYNQGAIDWKPVSCHLYPVRIKDFTEFAAVNYDKWDMWSSLFFLGQELEVPVYKFVKEALVRRFGEDYWAWKAQALQRKKPICFSWLLKTMADCG